MASRLEHLKIDKAVLGKECLVSHKWIDSKFPEYKGYEHWLHYHHVEAISKKYKVGTFEYNSAYLHVLYDFLTHFGIAFVPRNKEECENKLNSLGVMF